MENRSGEFKELNALLMMRHKNCLKWVFAKNFRRLICGLEVGDDRPHELCVPLDVHPVADVGEPHKVGVREDCPENENMLNHEVPSL